MAMEKSLYAAPQGLDMGEDMGVQIGRAHV